MPWTYASPLVEAKDVVRYLVGDVTAARPLVDDGEIMYALAQQPNVRLAAADIADAIALRLALRATMRVGDTQTNWSDRAPIYAALATKLRREAALESALPYAGGISLGDKEAHAAQTDAFVPSFTRAHADDTEG